MKNLRTNNKGIVGIIFAIIAVVIIIIASVAFYWASTHYTIDVGKVGVVTDQWGGFIRAEVGPKGYAEKGFFEKVNYYTSKVQTEEMVSPYTSKTLTIDGKQMTVISVEIGVPYQDEFTKCLYPTLAVTTKDATATMDLELQFHLNTMEGNWQEGIKTIYVNYPDEATAKEVIINMVRDYARRLAQEYTTQELVYGNTLDYSNRITAYVQAQIDSFPTLGKAVIIDKIFVRQTTAPESLQIQYNKVLEAQKAADTALIEAIGIRNSAIAKAEGQSTAISLVVNATTTAMRQLYEAGWTQEQVVTYLTTQYQFDSLKSIYLTNPQANITLFINTPDATYTIPLKPTT